MRHPIDVAALLLALLTASALACGPRTTTQSIDEPFKLTMTLPTELYHKGRPFHAVVSVKNSGDRERFTFSPIHKEAASNDNVRLQVLITTVFEEASQTNGTLEVTSHEEITFHCPELFELTGHTNRKMVSYHFVKPENAEQSDGEATSQPAPGTGAASQTSHP